MLVRNDMSRFHLNRKLFIYKKINFLSSCASPIIQLAFWTFIINPSPKLHTNISFKEFAEFSCIFSWNRNISQSSQNPDIKKIKLCGLYRLSFFCCCIRLNLKGQKSVYQNIIPEFYSLTWNITVICDVRIVYDGAV